MPSIVNNFIASLGGPVRAFPPSLRQTYTELITQFRLDPAIEGFDHENRGYGLRDPSPQGVAHRVYWWFPAHFFKFQDALLGWEEQCQQSGQAMLLDRPSVVFVDLGCGAGAASAAVLAILEQYQAFLASRNMEIGPIAVDLIALDSVQPELDLYDRFISSYASRLSLQKISVRIQTICQEFPQGTPQIVKALAPLRGHVLLVGMSNLINWIWSECDVYLETRDLAGLQRLQPEEADAFRHLAEQAGFDCFHVIGVATKSSRSWFLPHKLHALFTKVAAVLGLAGRPLGNRWRTQARVLFENPEGSGWANIHPQWPSNYYVENLANIAPQYAQDQRLADVMSLQALEVAWAKVRSYMRYESLTDLVELRLFENDLDANLRRLRAACLERDYQCLGIHHHLPYDFPKGANEVRPRSLARLEDQILAASVSIRFAHELEGPCPEISYSHRLAAADSEFLYEYWFSLYRQYLVDILKRLDHKHICTADIRSYYVSIEQSRLLETLRQRTRSSDRCYEFLQTTVARDCYAPHPAGFGLLQGHALSGLLANVMLQPVDSRLVHTRGMKGRYFRFADDFAVVGAADPDNDAVVPIQEELATLQVGLELNSEKTFQGNQREFRKRISGSRELDTVAKRFRALLLPIFLANRKYRREFARDEWHFVYGYQNLLESIGIYFSPEWLVRKLDEYAHLWRRVRAIGRKWNLDWPPLSLSHTVQGRQDWQRQFAQRNTAWMSERIALKTELSSMLTGAVGDLIAAVLPDDVLVRRRRTLKFALYRLSVLGVDLAVTEIVDIVQSQPWNIPGGLACQALSRIHAEDALVDILSGSQSSYVRAVALRSLGKTRSDKAVPFLASVLDSQAPEVEKLMASEGLLDANLWQQVSLDRIIAWLEQEADRPYVLKNVVLILGQAFPAEADNLLLRMEEGLLHPIVQRAIHYIRTKPPTENLLWKAEPDVLKKYRAKSYPTIEELLGDQGSYALVS